MFCLDQIQQFLTQFLNFSPAEKKNCNLLRKKIVTKEAKIKSCLSQSNFLFPFNLKSIMLALSAELSMKPLFFVEYPLPKFVRYRMTEKKENIYKDKQRVADTYINIKVEFFPHHLGISLSPPLLKMTETQSQPSRETAKGITH